MPSAVDYGLQLYFIVTKIVTSVLSGAVVDGPPDSRREPSVPRIRGRPHSGRSEFHAAAPGIDHPPPSPAQKPPVREGQRPAYPPIECASTHRSSLRLVRSPSSRLPDDPSDPHQEPGSSTRGHTQRLSSQTRAIGHQWTTRHGYTAQFSASPPVVHAVHLADLSGPRPEIVGLCAGGR